MAARRPPKASAAMKANSTNFAKNLNKRRNSFTGRISGGSGHGRQRRDRRGRFA